MISDLSILDDISHIPAMITFFSHVSYPPTNILISTNGIKSPPAPNVCKQGKRVREKEQAQGDSLPVPYQCAARMRMIMPPASSMSALV